MTLPRVNALMRFWGEHPPMLALGPMFAAFMGVKPGTSKAHQTEDEFFGQIG